MKYVKISVFCIFISLLLIAKPYQVPVGSKDNTIQLNIENKGEEGISEIKVQPENIPEFIELNQIQNIDSIPAGKAEKIKYRFNLNKAAQVDSTVKLKFNIQGTNTAKKTKEISLRTAAPQDFKLKQNYPNPFNPTTNISYHLPQESKVTINIYNIKGQKVETLVQNSQEAGIYQKKWNASQYSSGIYFYRIRIENSQGTKTKTRKMTVLK